MKRLILALSFFAAAIAAQAQSGMNQNHAIYMFNNPADPKPVYRLGMDPEFPFLRHLSSPQQVLSAMQRAQHDSRYRRQARELNELLMAAGFTRGINDVTLASIAPFQVDPGTTGNMGSGHFNYIYCKMSADHSFNAWKVTADNGTYISFLSPCGNAFYPGQYTVRQAISAITPVEAPIEVVAETAVVNTAEKKCNLCEVKEDDCNRCEVYKPRCGCEEEHYAYHYRRMHRRYYYGW